jgi:aspartyl/asparaginyl beta-hydroxylase (cupin superfamily)
VAICDGRIVAHDVSLKKTHEIAASKCPNKAPLFTKVPSSDAMIFSEVA